VESVVLLVLAVLFFVMAGRKWLKTPEEDAPPPAWMARLDGITPVRAFVLGASVLALAAKSWVFTLGAIGAIEVADLGPGGAAMTFLAFVVLAQGLHLALLGVAAAMPDRADAVLGRFADGMERYNRPIVVGLGLAFGTWFLLQALSGLGVI
jgi:hypothetical protein